MRRAERGHGRTWGVLQRVWWLELGFPMQGASYIAPGMAVLVWVCCARVWLDCARVCEALANSRPCAVDVWLSTCRHQKANYGLLNLAVLNKCADNSEVSYETCLEAGHMNKLHIKKGPTILRGKQMVPCPRSVFFCVFLSGTLSLPPPLSLLCQSVCLSVCLSVSQSGCLSACASLSVTTCGMQVKVIGCNDENREPVKLTAKGLTVKAHAFTASAVEQIQANGGKCVLLNPVTGQDLDMD